jgi:hypothetical protein
LQPSPSRNRCEQRITHRRSYREAAGRAASESRREGCLRFSKVLKF